MKTERWREKGRKTKKGIAWGNQTSCEAQHSWRNVSRRVRGCYIMDSFHSLEARGKTCIDIHMLFSFYIYLFITFFNRHNFWLLLQSSPGLSLVMKLQNTGVHVYIICYVLLNCVSECGFIMWPNIINEASTSGSNCTTPHTANGQHLVSLYNHITSRLWSSPSGL